MAGPLENRRSTGRRLIANKDKEIARLEAAYTRRWKRPASPSSKPAPWSPTPIPCNWRTASACARPTILIATGGAPSYGDPIPGIEHAISSNEAFHLPELPRQVVIQGGGYIAVEFAGIFAGLGSHVTLVYRGENILRGFDDDVRAHLRMDMEKRGIKVFTGCKVAAIERNPARILGASVERQSVTADCVMFATGRAPNVGQDRAQGSGRRDRQERRRRRRRIFAHERANIYAIGDVTNRVNLTPVAIREGHAFADTVFGGKPTAVDHANVPTAVFSDPEVGVVGMTEAQARARLAQTDVYKAMFKPLKATLSGRDTTVLIKLVVDGLTDRVVGCHVVGEGAAEMIQVAAIAVKMGATKADFDATMALHPTAAEELVTMRHKSASYAREAAE
jgi:glutathione reductase (NADPH)